MRALFDHVEDERAAAAELVERKPEEHRKEEHLQDFAFREGAHDGVRDDVHQEFRRRLHLARARIGRDGPRVEGRRIDVHAGPRLHDVDEREADDQRDRRDDFKVEKREAARLADGLHVLHPRDAGDDRTEDHRRDDHLDETDEPVAEGLHLRADVGGDDAEDDADDDRADHLKVEHLVDGRALVAERHAVFLRWGRRTGPSLSGRRRSAAAFWNSFAGRPPVVRPAAFSCRIAEEYRKTRGKSG